MRSQRLCSTEQSRVAPVRYVAASMPAARDELSLLQARRIALSAQGLRGRSSGGGVPAMLRRLGAVQLDTIAVLARSHELVAYARHGAIGRSTVERAYWGKGSSTFEYWSHAACVLPLEDWPLYEFKRRSRREKGRRWHHLEDRDKSCGEVLDRLGAEGPLTANELGGAKKSGSWWDWSETKIAAEWLLDIGDLVCRERRGFQRVYDLAERAIPAPLRDEQLSDEACAHQLVDAAGHALGIATVGDLAVYHGLPQRLVRQVLPATALLPVRVEGWKSPAFAHRSALDEVDKRAKGRRLLLSPFDSLCWYRDRLERLFGLRHRMEAYTPRAQRTYGYFAMPVLADTEIVGLVDPGRRDGALVAKQVTVLRPGVEADVAEALAAAARWVRSEDVVVERLAPASSRPALESALRTADTDW
jgi:uncharacterized protein YcaQ